MKLQVVFLVSTISVCCVLPYATATSETRRHECRNEYWNFAKVPSCAVLTNGGEEGADCVIPEYTCDLGTLTAENTCQFTKQKESTSFCKDIYIKSGNRCLRRRVPDYKCRSGDEFNASTGECTSATDGSTYSVVAVCKETETLTDETECNSEVSLSLCPETDKKCIYKLFPTVTCHKGVITNGVCVKNGSTYPAVQSCPLYYVEVGSSINDGRKVCTQKIMIPYGSDCPRHFHFV